MNGESVGEFVTNEAGFFVVPDLPAGWYTAWEISAPAGYVTDSTPQNIELKHGVTAILKFENVPLAGLQIRKINSIDGKPLAGVTLQISKQNGEQLGSFVTDDNGLVFVENLVAGTYVVTETETLPGYKLDSTPKTVEVAPGEMTQLMFENLPFPTLKIVKVDSVTKEPLSDVAFTLFDKDGKSLGVFQTNRLGNILLTGMDAGEYILQETKAPEGYVLDSTPHEVSLLWGQTTDLSVENVPKSTLSLLKVDKESGKPLQGAVFLMYDGKNNLLGEFTSDENGVRPRFHLALTFKRGFSVCVTTTLCHYPGKYTVHMVENFAGYVLDETIHKITLEAGSTAQLKVDNLPERGKISVLKLSADDNPITKSKAGTPLAGAVFQITNDKKEVVATITTDENGKAETPDLPLGTYGIQETTAPEYYFTEGKLFYAQLKLHGDVVSFEVENNSVKPEVSVTKTGNEEVIPGDTMFYDFAQITNRSNVALGQHRTMNANSLSAALLENFP